MPLCCGIPLVPTPPGLQSMWCAHRTAQVVWKLLSSKFFSYSSSPEHKKGKTGHFWAKNENTLVFRNVCWRWWGGFCAKPQYPELFRSIKGEKCYYKVVALVLVFSLELHALEVLISDAIVSPLSPACVGIWGEKSSKRKHKLRWCCCRAVELIHPLIDQWVWVFLL